MRMEQIRPKALICFETKTTLHHVTSNNSMALNHREVSSRDLIQVSHKLSFFIYVKGDIWSHPQHHLPPKPQLWRGKARPHIPPFPTGEGTAKKVSWDFLGGEIRRKCDYEDAKRDKEAAFITHQPALPPSISRPGGFPPPSSWTLALHPDVKVLVHFEGWREMKA